MEGERDTLTETEKGSGPANVRNVMTGVMFQLLSASGTL